MLLPTMDVNRYKILEVEGKTLRLAVYCSRSQTHGPSFPAINSGNRPVTVDQLIKGTLEFLPAGIRQMKRPPKVFIHD